jgi:L-fucose mutarotase
VLKTKLLHPEILAALGRAGHGSRVLIADGNYPFTTGSPPAAEKIFLNLMPGTVKVTDVLTALVGTIPIEAAMAMTPPDGAAQPIHEEFRALLPPGMELSREKRFEFYEAVKLPQTVLVIATGEQRQFGNLLLTIGVVKQERP